MHPDEVVDTSMVPYPISVPAEPEGAADRGPPLISVIFTIIRRRKWAIIGAMAFGLAAALVVTLLMTRQYRAMAVLEIQRESASFVDTEGSAPQSSRILDQEYYETQFGLLETKALASRIATDLKLPDDEKFFKLFGVKRADDWFSNGVPTAEAPSRSERLRIAAGILLAHFDTDPKRMSHLVKISFTSPDATFSKRVIDTWSADFIKVTLERRMDATSYARNFLERRLRQLRVA
ncbi:MAG: Wzz/FepE/Etk N-terminal domain-containing protein [Novosphingobium sp.]